MQIRQDPITKLWCRNDGAVLMPPSRGRFKTFRWAFGYKRPNGYKQVKFQSKTYKAHQIVCRAFNGLAPTGRPLVDHINRIRHDNRPENLRWVSYKENNDNADRVDQSIEKYGVRACEDRAAWGRAYRERRKSEAA